ncbi:MAG: hydantoinase B/oxoprolinase family protein, partial [Alphaproteobacteria bacterium]|nr:hydantoinase B/oxoprolinase family protein [Alphaproteobacteria bacterium]
ALARDFSCAIYDAKTRQICMMDALPVHTNSMHVVLREIARVFEGNIHDGDVIVCNHAYSGNTHVGDFVTACPIFHDGKHMFWSMTKGHQLDCGAFIPTSTPAAAQNVWQEGLQLPPIKFYEKGKRREDVVRMYLANMRWQEWLYGDFMAQLGSIWTGRRRLVELAETYGNDEMEKYVEGIFDYADMRMASEIRTMPDGDYDGVSWLDTDGQGGTNIEVRARVSIRDDKVHINFAGSAPQTPGANNSSFGVMQAAAGIPIMCAIDPSIPHNDGCLRHISAEAPEGSVCNAQYPASTALATIGPDDTMQDAVWKALAKAVPERVIGGNGRIPNVPFFSGTDSREAEDREWGCMFFNGATAGGATGKSDGWPLIMTSAGMGGLKIMSVELCELLYPFRIDRQEIASDSMGHGEHLGGPGVDIQVSPTSAPMQCELYGEGQSNPPFGVIGGTPSIGGGSYKENLKTGKRTYFSSKGRFTLGEGDVWVGRSSGGGGYGDPLQRQPEAVLASVFDGLLTIECANDVYGVVIDRAAMAIDFATTRALRGKIAAARAALEISSPNCPGAADWVLRDMRQGDEYFIDAQ